MTDYFDSVQTQLSGLCARQAHRQRTWDRLPRPGISMVMLVASAAITVTVAVLALGLLSADRHGIAPPPGGQRPSASARRPELLRGIPQRDRILGDPRAPVEITYVADLECPICRQFTLGPVFRDAVQNAVRSGQAKLYFRSLCTSTCSWPDSTRTARGRPSTFVVQQAAAYAAGRQNRLWDYALLFFKKQGREGTPYVTARFLKRLAAGVPGLNIARWQADRKNAGTLAEVDADTGYTRAHRIAATPTLVVTGPKGTVTLVGDQTSYQPLERAIARVRGQSATEPISPKPRLEANGKAQTVRHATLRLPTGAATKTFTIAALAGRAYDVKLTAPARSALGMRMRIAPGTGLTVRTGDRTACRAASGRTVCIWHFASGGNPGGAWTALLRKRAGPGATVELSITFLRPQGAP